jgi:deoxyribonuclease-4
MKKNRSNLLIGAHMSIKGGLYQALLDGFSIDCKAIQLFVHSNRQWHMPPLHDADIKRFDEARTQTGITRIIAHASYLLNLGSPDKTVRDKSRSTLIEELNRCSLLGIESLVMHPGSATGSDPLEALKRIGEESAQALSAAQGKTRLLFETMAGQGASLGSTIEELGKIITYTSNHAETGICIDTCHIFAAGYDISTKEAYALFMQNIDEKIGIERIGAFHMNDSAKPQGSRVDRHADIGKGSIESTSFSAILNDIRFMNVPKILETPKGAGKDHLKADARNLEALRELYQSDQ